MEARPIGQPQRPPCRTRQAFSNGFLKDLAEVWQAEGKGTMLHTAKTQPATFFAVCARLIPSDVKLTVEQTYGGLSAEELAMLRAARDEIPGVEDMTPNQVFELVRDALRMAAAKEIK
jgi:hypothetical protein